MEKQHTSKRAMHAIAIPSLVELQLDSFRWFMEEGLAELFRSFSPIMDFTGTTGIELVDFTLGEPKYSLEQCRSRDVTFEVPIKAKVRLMSPNAEVQESEVYLGDLPLMTEKGTFVVNGAERVVVSQLSRSAGIYFRDSLNLGLEWEFFATIIPSEGPWVDIETDSSNAITVRIGQNKKFAVTTLLRALHAFVPASPEGDIEVGFAEIKGKTLAKPVIDSVTGEILLDKGVVVSDDDYRTAERALGGERAVRDLRATVYLAPIQAETTEDILKLFGTASTIAPLDVDTLVGTDVKRDTVKYAVADIYDNAGQTHRCRLQKDR